MQNMPWLPETSEQSQADPLLVSVKKRGALQIYDYNYNNKSAIRKLFLAIQSVL